MAETMTAIKGEALVTIRVPFEYEIDDAEFAEWANKPLSEAKQGEIIEFMESGWEPWEYDAAWDDGMNRALSAFEVYETVIDEVWRTVV